MPTWTTVLALGPSRAAAISLEASVTSTGELQGVSLGAGVVVSLWHTWDEAGAPVYGVRLTVRSANWQQITVPAQWHVVADAAHDTKATSIREAYRSGEWGRAAAGVHAHEALRKSLSPVPDYPTVASL